MALSLFSLTPFCTYSVLPLQKNGLMKASKTVSCMTTAPVVRRTANYQPPIWDYDYVQSLSSNYLGDNYKNRANKLKEAVRMMLVKVENPLSTLQLVDVLQRLGVSYHFEDEISRIMESLYNNHCCSYEKLNEQNLSAKALGFRLLRQHGYHIPQEIFNEFRDENGNFKASLCTDIEGLLNFYEASYLSFEDESILDEANVFTTMHLKENLKNNNLDPIMSALVSHALELPLHWRVPRMEARWFIEVYEKRRDMNPMLLEFAKLDFNMLQAIQQEDLKNASRWWKSTCWGNKLIFARDRLMENFLWTAEINYEPHFRYMRKTQTKVNALVTTIDDVYDVYGTLDELEQFTDFICRWDINAIGELPDYMKICFLGFYNSINEITYDTLVEQGFLIIPYLKKADEYKRGDAPKSIQCYMHESGASEEEAREHIKHLIGKTWKKINKERVQNSLFNLPFIKTAMNLARMAQCMYQHGDGHGSQDFFSRARVLSLLIDPVQGV